MWFQLQCHCSLLYITDISLLRTFDCASIYISLKLGHAPWIYIKEWYPSCAMSFVLMEKQVTVTSERNTLMSRQQHLLVNVTIYTPSNTTWQDPWSYLHCILTIALLQYYCVKTTFIVVTCVWVIFLKFPADAWGLQAWGHRVDISGRPLMPMLQLLCNTSVVG